MATFVLISGAWHASWCWERIRPLLEAFGHKVVAPDLLGMGPDTTPVATVSLADWGDQVAQVVSAQLEPVILVGHSRGGIVISEVAERVPDKVCKLVYLAAFLLTDGVSIIEASARVPRLDAGDLMEIHPDQTTTIKSARVGSTFYNTTDPEWVARARSLLSAEPIAGLITPIHITLARYGSIARAYIECRQDYAVPIALQRIFQDESPCNHVFTLETDHSPFYSAPVELVEILEALAHC